ncbi:MAG: YceI family protein [Marinoscillum sp.]
MKLLISAIFALVLTGNQWSFMADASNSIMDIHGTSSVHDWTSHVEKFTVAGVINDNSITGLEVVVNTQSIKSGKSIMDDKTYEALGAKTHPTIKFTASTLPIQNGTIKGTGQLTLAGVTKPIPLQAATSTMTDGSLKVTGKVNVNMAEFGIEPPTAMFGTLTTGAEVTIEYQLLLNK